MFRNRVTDFVDRLAGFIIDAMAMTLYKPTSKNRFLGNL